MPVTRPWTVRLLELIDAGVHDRDELIRKATAWVPPGHAYRTRERARRAKYEARREAGLRKAQPRKEISAEEVHRVGARAVLNCSLLSMVSNGILMREGNTFRRPTPAAAPAESEPERKRRRRRRGRRGRRGRGREAA